MERTIWGMSRDEFAEELDRSSLDVSISSFAYHAAVEAVGDDEPDELFRLAATAARGAAAAVYAATDWRVLDDDARNDTHNRAKDAARSAAKIASDAARESDHA